MTRLHRIDWPDGARSYVHFAMAGMTSYIALDGNCAWTIRIVGSKSPRPHWRVVREGPVE